MSHTPKNIVIVGATSAIATAVACRWARNGATFLLIGRDAERTEQVKKTLEDLGASRCFTYITAVEAEQNHQTMVTQSVACLGSVDCVMIAHGVLAKQADLDANTDAMLHNFMVNAVHSMSIMARFATLLERQKFGTMVVLSSVAGDRGRKTNYTYGAAKAALTAFASGLRGRLAPSGVYVVTVKPGPVNTPMVSGRGMPLVATVDSVAKDIDAAVKRKKAVVYTPAFWRIIMFVVRLLPERIFMRSRF